MYMYIYKYINIHIYIYIYIYIYTFVYHAALFNLDLFLFFRQHFFYLFYVNISKRIQQKLSDKNCRNA